MCTCHFIPFVLRARLRTFTMAPKSTRLEEIVRKRVRELRCEQGLTQEELCERAGISVDAVSRIEGGSRVPTLETLARLASALSLSPVAFLDGLNVPAPKAPSRSLRRIVALLDQEPVEIQRMSEEVVATIVRGFRGVGPQATKK